MTTTIRQEYHPNPTMLYVKATNKKEILNLKSILHHWAEDAHHQDYNLRIELETIELKLAHCRHIWCAGYDRSVVHDLIQLCQGINSQKKRLFGDIEIYLMIDGSGFQVVECNHDLDILDQSNYF